MRRLLRWGLTAVLAALALLLLAFVLLWAAWTWRQLRESWSLHRTAFGEVAPGAERLESRARLGLFQGFGCSYSVVDLPDGTPDQAPTRDIAIPNAVLRAGDWRAGPSPFFAPGAGYERDPLSFCAHDHWSDTLTARIRDAAHDPASWWIEGYEESGLYAPAHGLALIVRRSD
ncbi:hypothetical protein ACRARG_04970 [Pseudooceanicola sp. C21-150M6]|uniref:hypothetical protein n=1 Tax=Pseudooceanicola sp. C21-150M6 TaxID=3434355 RepID=UPI003D7F1DCD